MKLNVCLIDDALLQIERIDKIFTEYQIQANLNNLAPDGADEHEINLKNFIDSMVKDSSIVLHGYTNPVTYNNNIGSQPAFDVVIYDWEYGPTGATINSKEQLEKMIEESHCFVYVYSHMSSESVIKEINEIKVKYPHRIIDFLQKGDTNSADQLSGKIQELKESNFSAKFAKELRINASKSVEKILVKLAHLDIEKFHKMMGTNNEEKKKDIVEFIAEKFKNNMTEMEFSLAEATEATAAEADASSSEQQVVEPAQEPSIKELWHYRMYSTIGDKRVRKGDIYKKIDTEDEYILIMTPNCQLVKYHDNKTFGILNYCNLTTTSHLEDSVKKLVLHEGTASARNTCVGKPYSKGRLKPVYSLINQIGSKESAPYILPYVTLEDVNLILFPKMYTYMEIQVKNHPEYLQREEISDYKYVTSLSEPFLSELIKDIYDKLERNGVPNFSDQVQKEIEEILLGSFTS